LSTASELRFGEKGAIRVTVDGAYRGKYTDWSNDFHGDIIDLIIAETGLAYADALWWSRDFVFAEGSPRPRPARPSPATSSTQSRNRAFMLWESSAPLIGSPAEIYLRSRLPTLDIPGPLLREDALRWTEDNPVRGTIGAMVALLVDPLTGDPAGIHRTFLNLEGKRAFRGFLGARGVLAFYPDTTILDRVLIGEGIETTLSASILFEIPSIAVLSAGAMAEFPTMVGVKELVIAGDHDVPESSAVLGPGQLAMAKCRDLWLEEGRSVITKLPKAPGNDFNDVLLEVLHE
jgi:hypothetical protein